MPGTFARDLSGTVAVLGVGNAMRGDDGAGSLLAQRLKGSVPWIVYDAAQSPENYLGKLGKDAPQHILIVDAADFKGVPGETRVFTADDISAVQFCTTHNASLSFVINYLRESTPVNIIILAIQPGTTAFGSALSSGVAAALDRVEGELRAAAHNARLA